MTSTKLPVLLLTFATLMIPLKGSSGTAAETANRLAKVLENNLPEGPLKCSLGRLRDTIKPELYESDRLIGLDNTGMKLHFDRMMRTSSCLSKVASGFWSEVDTEIRKNTTGDFSTRPALNERSGEGRYANFKEGWLWDKALQASHGNSNAAMTILSVCMHDDTGLQVAMADGADDLICPYGTSPIFAPRSVDSRFDLPETLKNAIALVQRPNGGVKDLRAKAYHFMAGAYVGCQLAQCDVSADLASQAAGALAGAYRALRLCPEIKHRLQELQTLRDSLDVEPASPEFHTKYREMLRKAFHSETRTSNPPTEEEITQQTQLEELYKSQLVSTEKWLVELDASLLYSNWYFGGPNVLSGEIPCTEIRLGGPAQINAMDPLKVPRPNTLGGPALGTLCGIPGWSVERCEKARMKLSTWDIDFQWTRTQHEIGARFGAERCQPSSQTLDQVLCKK